MFVSIVLRFRGRHDAGPIFAGSLSPSSANKRTKTWKKGRCTTCAILGMAQLVGHWRFPLRSCISLRSPSVIVIQMRRPHVSLSTGEACLPSSAINVSHESNGKSMTLVRLRATSTPAKPGPLMALAVTKAPSCRSEFQPYRGRPYRLGSHQPQCMSRILHTCILGGADTHSGPSPSLLTSPAWTLTTLTPFSLSSFFTASSHCAESTALVPSSIRKVLNPSAAASAAVHLTQ